MINQVYTYVKWAVYTLLLSFEPGLHNRMPIWCTTGPRGWASGLPVDQPGIQLINRRPVNQPAGFTSGQNIYIMYTVYVLMYNMHNVGILAGTLPAAVLVAAAVILISCGLFGFCMYKRRQKMKRLKVHVASVLGGSKCTCLIYCIMILQ